MPNYVYAIVPQAAAEPPPILGVAGASLYAIAAAGLAAIVSDYPAATIRAERRHLAAVQAVHRVLQAQRDMLPVAFGTLAPSAEFVRSFLEGNAEALTARLDRLKGAVEMAVRLRLEAADPLAWVVAHSPELQHARDRAFSHRREPGYEERLRLGRLCEAALYRFRQSLSGQVVAVLKPACCEITELPVRDDCDVANIAALVPRDGVGAFEALVEAAAAEFEDAFTFNLTGPWPPHHFAQLELPI